MEDCRLRGGPIHVDGLTARRGDYAEAGWGG